MEDHFAFLRCYRNPVQPILKALRLQSNAIIFHVLHKCDQCKPQVSHFKLACYFSQFLLLKRRQGARNFHLELHPLLLDWHYKSTGVDFL